MKNGYTQDELRELAAEHGHVVSDVQFGRWHRFGLLPDPQRRWLGKGQGSAKALYPPRTVDRLLRLCELRIEKHERRHHYLAWHLWWEGYDVSMRRVREFLEAVAGGWDDAIAEGEGKTPQELRAMTEAELGEKQRFTGDAKILSRIRRRVGKARLPDFASSLLLSQSDNEADAERIVEALGLQFLFGTFLSQKVLGDSDAKEVVQASREALSSPYRERLATISDTDLCATRVRLQAALVEVEGLRVVLRQVGGDSAQALIDMLLPSEATSQARLLLVMGPLLEDPAYVGPTPSEGSLTVRDFAPLFQFLELLMREVPALVDWDILTPRRVKAAAHDIAQLDRLVGAIQNFAKDNPHEFEGFLTNHPEARRKLYPEDGAEVSAK